MKNVLIVEDDVSMQRVLKDKFEEAGFAITLAQTGKQGLDQMGHSQFDVILLDILMPEMNGMVFLEEVQKLHIPTPILVLSNLTSEESVKKARALGARDYIVKSDTTIEDIIKRVTDCCGVPRG